MEKHKDTKQQSDTEQRGNGTAPEWITRGHALEAEFRSYSSAMISRKVIEVIA